MALEVVPEIWRSSSSQPLMVDEGRLFPYLCNNVFLMRADLYEHVIQDPRLEMGGADEVSLNRVLAERRLPICHLANSFGIHPAYSTHRRKALLEGLAAEV